MPSSGDYLLQNGCIQNANSLLSEFYFRLATPLGSYIYDKTLGNQLLNLQYVPSVTEIKQALTNSIAPMITAGRIKNVLITILVYLASAYSALITAIDSSGSPVEYKWSKINL